jgi:hypothetical protein
VGGDEVREDEIKGDEVSLVERERERENMVET